MADEPTEEEILAALEGRAEEIERNDGFGLDKDGRLADRRIQAAEDALPGSLDPPFPYVVEKFDPGLGRKWGL